MKRFAVLPLLLFVFACGTEVTSVDPPGEIDALRSAELDGKKPDIPPDVLAGMKSFDTGGPDLFGYSWIDSDEFGGPSFDWMEISGVGIPVPFASPISDDQTVGPIAIGFDFPFYGNAFNQIYISTNGNPISGQTIDIV